MKLRSLGYCTDLIFNGFDGSIRDRGDYLVVESPNNPGFYWGNLLLFRRAPQDGDLANWRARFKEEFAHQPLIKHITFGWDVTSDDSGATSQFIDAGFDVETCIILSASRVHAPPKIHPEIEVRPIRSDEEWEQLLKNQIHCEAVEGPVSDDEQLFMKRRNSRYRLMSEAGLGRWFGAYIKDELVADLGLFVKGGLARFQNVQTQPEFRRQGICGTMVWQVSQAALDGMGAEKLVMAADEGYHAAKIYESVGFLPLEKQHGACLKPY